MAKITTAAQLAARAKDVAQNYKTLYTKGCFGSPMTSANKDRYTRNHDYNKQPVRKAMIMDATSDTFGFDCVCLIKGLLWGWCGDKNAKYGGATYATNGVPDINADAMIKVCKDLSTDFSSVEVGEALWKPGHIGIYIGDGLAVECTPAWKNGVQITACNCTKSGYNRQNWTKHGKLPYVEYSAPAPAEKPTAAAKTVEEIAKEVLAGKWGNGSDRTKKLTAAGYDPAEVQKIVNELCKPAKKSNEEIAKEVLAGKWGNGSDRKKRLTAAGYDPAEIQALVNKLL